MTNCPYLDASHDCVEDILASTVIEADDVRWIGRVSGGVNAATHSRLTVPLQLHTEIRTGDMGIPGAAG
jgi:hypothetical protein